MLRQFRIEYEWAIYHALARGESKQAFLPGNAVRHELRNFWRMHGKNSGFAFYSYCLMNVNSYETAGI
jgi:hypothetical protein